MYKFAKVKLLYLKEKPTYWYLYITNMLELFKYLDIANKNHVETYYHIKMKHKNCDHFNSDLERAVGCLFFANNNHRKTVIDDINHISDNLSKPKIRMVLEGKSLLIGSNLLGFCHYDNKSHKIIKIIEKETIIFPNDIYTEKDIRIMKWENGTHYYAKIGKYDVYDLEGNQKWYSEIKARKEALAFLNRRVLKQES